MPAHGRELLAQAVERHLGSGADFVVLPAAPVVLLRRPQTVPNPAAGPGCPAPWSGFPVPGATVPHDGLQGYPIVLQWREQGMEVLFRVCPKAIHKSRGAVFVIIISFIVSHLSRSGLCVVQSVVAWTEIARAVRGRFLALWEAGFVLAARFRGASGVPYYFQASGAFHDQSSDRGAASAHSGDDPGRDHTQRYRPGIADTGCM